MFGNTGVQLLKLYQTQYAEKEKQRQELTNAEKLFDLDITMYPGMIEVDSDLKNIAKVYEIYEAQRVRERERSVFFAFSHLKVVLFTHNMHVDCPRRLVQYIVGRP